MATEVTREFRLTVWRPLSYSRRLAFGKIDADAHASYVDPDALQEAIYEWQPNIDMWSSISDREVTDRVRGLLLQRFDPYEKPEDRLLSRLGESVETIDAIANKDGSGQWADCAAIIVETEVEIHYRANTLLCLARHLQWIHDVFCNVPGATVTIR